MYAIRRPCADRRLPAVADSCAEAAEAPCAGLLRAIPFLARARQSPQGPRSGNRPGTRHAGTWLRSAGIRWRTRMTMRTMGFAAACAAFVLLAAPAAARSIGNDLPWCGEVEGMSGGGVTSLDECE